MWKENLPKSCPPRKAIEQEVQVYRVLSTNTPSIEDFKNYCELYPDNLRYKGMCKAYALSFFDSIENALSAMKRSTNLNGTHVGLYKVNQSHGVCEFKSETGHYSLWRYKNWNFDEFIPINISPLNEN